MRGRRIGHERLIELIGKVYDAALDENLWAGLAPEIAATFDASSTAVQVRNARYGTVDLLALTNNYSPDLLHSYSSYYAARDIWVERALSVGLSTVVASKDIIEDREFERTEIYNDWCRKVDVFYLVGAVIPIGRDENGIIGVHRPRGAATFDESDKAKLAMFLPHLQRALQLRRRLINPAIERQAALDFLDRTATAAIVAGRDGLILYANHQAEILLGEADAIHVVNQRLTARGRIGMAQLSAAIREAADTAFGRGGGSSGGVLSLPRADRLPITVLVAPFRPARDGVGAPMPAAILFVRDPEALAPSAMALQGLFGLTAAEATVASLLADGKSVDAIAAALGITVNTARTHVKNILSKTGTSRQSQLVALILRSVAVMVPKK